MGQGQAAGTAAAICAAKVFVYFSWDTLISGVPWSRIMSILKVEVNNSYFLSSILKPITCHTGIFAGFLIISASICLFPADSFITA
ncbi:MAG: hypothetical protein MZV63_15405 [Marinilabiliales bacterium]|nr:hypothetical protein [Marinilabiliales bacterium]